MAGTAFRAGAVIALTASTLAGRHLALVSSVATQTLTRDDAR
ncbi:hypothetical protein [Frankia sp. Cj3]|nr:hypothetical protein [Frankia sp. Cj3]